MGFTGEQRHGDALAEVEVLHGLLLLLFRQRGGLHAARDADDGDADEGHHHADDDGARQVTRVTGEDRAQDGAERRTGTERDALAEGDAEIAHAEAEGQTAHAPQRTEKDGEPGGLGIRVHHGEQVAEAPARPGDGKEGAHQREEQPGEDALDNPVALPAPILDLVDRDVARTLAERPDRDD